MERPVERAEQQPMAMGERHVEVREEMRRGRGRGERARNMLSTWLTGFAFGAAVGSIAGILFAPRRGSELRSALMESLPRQAVSNEFKTRVAEMMAAGRNPGDMIGQYQRDLGDLRGQALNKLDDAKLRAQIIRKEAELRYLQGKEKLRKEV